MSETSPLTLSDIHPKQELTGKVKQVKLEGAVIDIGAEVDALLHISQIQAGRVKNVGDVLQEGQDVIVWVRRVDQESKHVTVTMIKPPAISWNEMAVGQVYKGKVVRIEKFGVFVDIGAERPGLVHISELASGFVAKPEDVVQKGDEVEVKIIGVNRRKNQIDLSMKVLAATPVQETTQEPTEELPTAMALALQRALQEGKPEIRSEGSAGRKGSRHQDNKQEEILRRTLQRLEDK